MSVRRAHSPILHGALGREDTGDYLRHWMGGGAGGQGSREPPHSKAVPSGESPMMGQGRGVADRVEIKDTEWL